MITADDYFVITAKGNSLTTEIDITDIGVAKSIVKELERNIKYLNKNIKVEEK